MNANLTRGTSCSPGAVVKFQLEPLPVEEEFARIQQDSNQAVCTKIDLEKPDSKPADDALLNWKMKETRDTKISAVVACVGMAIAAVLGLLTIPSAAFYALGFVVASGIAVRSLSGIPSKLDEHHCLNR